MTETALVKMVIRWLHLKGCLAIRINCGQMLLGGHKKRMFRGAAPGTSDVLGMLPDGRFFAVECKARRNKLTKNQAMFLDSVKERGGVGVVARNLDDLERELEPYLVTGAAAESLGRRWAGKDDIKSESTIWMKK